jgi:hypothetical protein
MSTQETAPDVSFDRLVRVYMKIRDAAQEVQRRYDAELEALKSQQSEVALALKDQMRAMGESTTSVKTQYGTAMLTKKTRYYASDWDDFKSFVLEHGAVDLFEKRIAQSNMATFLEENPGLVPPGLNSITEFDVSVRKPSAR